MLIDGNGREQRSEASKGMVDVDFPTRYFLLQTHLTKFKTSLLELLT